MSCSTVQARAGTEASRSGCTPVLLLWNRRGDQVVTGRLRHLYTSHGTSKEPHLFLKHRIHKREGMYYKGAGMWRCNGRSSPMVGHTKDSMGRCGTRWSQPFDQCDDKSSNVIWIRLRSVLWCWFNKQANVRVALVARKEQQI